MSRLRKRAFRVLVVELVVALLFVAVFVGAPGLVTDRIGEHAEIRVVNHDTVSHRVDVSVETLFENENTVVFERSYRVASESAEHTADTRIGSGSYVLTVESDSSERLRRNFEVDCNPTVVTVVVSEPPTDSTDSLDVRLTRNC
ncbi:MAG: hypothetical protein SV253_02075 [Halobacteria archaeon]|nr:hypothetical protein [Halobacteria archaeon]